MLTVHHLGVSQSERIVWLCEELGIPYELKLYQRLPTKQAPPEYNALHPMGLAPVITDDDLVLAESGAVVDYILGTYGNGRLRPGPADAGFADYLYWFHFANGSFQPAVMRVLITQRLGAAPDHPAAAIGVKRLGMMLAMLDARLKDNTWLAGAAFTAADIMPVFTLTTMRHYAPYDLTPYPNILSYLQRVAARPAYQRAMSKGDPGMALLLG
ncbi:glutathione S-transferase family protein [Ferrovibrio terrae]|uniref:glutathione S-transferase family protein n=1 Tax=Ferrovibrio terrae TaxID=2594003 RepID=UPI003137966C